MARRWRPSGSKPNWARCCLSASCWTPRSLPWRPTALWPAGGRGDEPDPLALKQPALWPGPCVPGLARLTGQRLSASLLLSARTAAASRSGWADAGCGLVGGDPRGSVASLRGGSGLDRRAVSKGGWRRGWHDAGQRVQGSAVHGRGDPVGRALVSDVPDQLPRSRTDAAGPRCRGGPHNPVPLDPSLCPEAGEADPTPSAGVQRLVAGRRDIRQGEGPLDLPVSSGG